jgi:hypothetical protein
MEQADRRNPAMLGIIGTLLGAALGYALVASRPEAARAVGEALRARLDQGVPDWLVPAAVMAGAIALSAAAVALVARALDGLLTAFTGLVGREASMQRAQIVALRAELANTSEFASMAEARAVEAERNLQLLTNRGESTQDFLTAAKGERRSGGVLLGFVIALLLCGGAGAAGYYELYMPMHSKLSKAEGVFEQAKKEHLAALAALREEGVAAKAGLASELDAERAKLDEKLAALDAKQAELEACQAGDEAEEEPKAKPKPKPKRKRRVSKRRAKPKPQTDKLGLGSSIDDDPIGGL